MFSFEAFALSGDIGGHIGKVGSPVEPCGPGTGKDCPPPPPMKLVGPYLLQEVEFNQYSNLVGLQQAVAGNEQNYKDSVYEIVSTIPDLSSIDQSQVAALSNKFDANVEAVVKAIESAHVPQKRIRGRQESDPDASGQKVTVFMYLSVPAD